MCRYCNHPAPAIIEKLSLGVPAYPAVHEEIESESSKAAGQLHYTRLDF